MSLYFKDTRVVVAAVEVQEEQRNLQFQLYIHTLRALELSIGQKSEDKNHDIEIKSHVYMTYGII